MPSQVPLLLNYQGRVTVGGNAFAGTGQFRFALVNAAGTTTYWSNDGTSVNGSQPTNAVSIVVGGPPANGTANVLLGDTTIPNMTAIPVTVFSTNSDVRLRVWFNDGTNGSQRLDPDQRIAATGYAAIASTVPDGAITGPKIAAGAVTGANVAAATLTGGNVATGPTALTGANLANGTVTSTQLTLANGSVTGAQLATGAASANLQGSGVSSVASGGIVLSAEPSSASLNAAGYVRVGALAPTPDSWQTPRPNSVPSGRRYATAVWTGNVLIVWGGNESGARAVDDGGRYNPTTNSWQLLAQAGAPSSREYHSAVWTGSEMVIWGGRSTSAIATNTGGKYNPVTDRWVSTSIAGALTPRYLHTAVWTGSEMLIFGGVSSAPATVYGDGSAYNPLTDSWVPTGTAGSIASPRFSHTAVWSGSEMIIWGGSQGSNIFLATGSRYNSTLRNWTALPAGAPDAREYHSAVWTGPPQNKMIIWGGLNQSFAPISTGGAYSISNNSWTPTNPAGAPDPRANHVAVWDTINSNMIVWGGSGSSTSLSDGSRYDPIANNWNTLSPAPLTGRYYHVGIWTGTEMIVWGGSSQNAPDYSDGARYLPSPSNSWVSMRSSGAPSPRLYHTMVWTGAEVLIWGGTNDSTGNTSFADGGRFDPATNQWTPIGSGGIARPRHRHCAVWTGSEMLVWGGYHAAYLNSGDRYNPSSGNWTVMPTPNAPLARANAVSAWTGTYFLVWGGDSSIYHADGGRFDPNAGWLASGMGSSGIMGRIGHSSVWTGTEMIVWGGYNSAGVAAHNTGARYNPTSNQWVLLPTVGAPSARAGHSAVWTGLDMLIWGGTSEAGPGATDNRRYRPSTDSWSAYSEVGDPSPRFCQRAVWTGTDMIIFGGQELPGSLRMDGARYNPSNDQWTSITLNGAPLASATFPQDSMGAVWTGTQMLVFGGGDVFQRVPGDNRISGYRPSIQLYLYLRP